MMEKVEAVIVGCGPSGIAAAVQLKRMGVSPLVFEKRRVGGLLVNAHLVENYPGFPEGISGIELVGLMEEHLRRQDVEVALEEVTCLEPGDAGFILCTTERRIRTAIVIIASGTRPKDVGGLDVPAGLEDKILYEVYPIREVRERSILIVGSGDAAFDYSLSLGPRNDVTIMNRSRSVKCLRLLWRRSEASPRIKYLDETSPMSVAAVGDGVEVTCRTPKDYRTFRADYIIFATGRESELGFASEGVKGNLKSLQEAGLLYLIGDVRTGSMRQTAIAVGDGVMAAMKVCAKLEELRR